MTPGTATTSGTTSVGLASTATGATGEGTPVISGTTGHTPANPTMLPLEVMLRDRFVCGITDEHLQQRLFAETNLTFQKAYDMAVRTESAAQHQRDLKTHKEEVHAVKKEQLPPKQLSTSGSRQRDLQTCYRCQEQHSAYSC